MVKKIVALLVVVAILIIIVQAVQYFTEYGKATSLLDKMILTYWDSTQLEFKRDLVAELRTVGIELDIHKIEVAEVTHRREVTVTVRYTRILNILFVSIERDGLLERTSRDVDFSG